VAMDRIRRWLVIGTLSLFTILLGFAVPSAAARSHGTNSTITLRVSTCPSSYASPDVPEGTVATSATVTVPTNLKRAFSLFTDAKRRMAPLLAPRGWHCSVDVGEDGSAGISLYPTKKTPSVSKDSNAEEIVASTDGACQGCIADDVCPYFENAQTQIGYTNMSCSTTKPNNEQDDYVTGSNTSDHGEVDTYDPPTKKSKYAAYGVLRYDEVTGGGAEDAREVCTLAKKDASWCKAILKEFVAKDWEFSLLSAPPPTTTTTTTQPAAAGIGSSVDLADGTGNALVVTLVGVGPDTVDDTALGYCLSSNEEIVAAQIQLQNDGSTVLESTDAPAGAVLVDANATPIAPNSCDELSNSTDAYPACANSSVSLDLAPEDTGVICPIVVVPTGTTLAEVQFDASEPFQAFGDVGNDAIWHTG
jgi:hypothetical protein